MMATNYGELKTFDKVWHLCLHYKLRSNGISAKLLNTFTDFFKLQNPKSDVKWSLFLSD